MLGVEIIGSAGGAFCDHYILEWKPAGAPDTAYTQTSIVYAGGAPGGPGPCGVSNSTLGWLDTASNPVPDASQCGCASMASTAAVPTCCTTEFQIFRQRVWIKDIEGVQPGPNGILDPSAPAGDRHDVRAFGTALEIDGRAWVGQVRGPRDQALHALLPARLRHRPARRAVDAILAGRLPEPAAAEGDPDKRLRPHELLGLRPDRPALTALPARNLDPKGLADADALVVGTTRRRARRSHRSRSRSTRRPGRHGPLSNSRWSTASRAGTRCCSTSRTRLGVHYYDTQQVWFDNKEIHGKITQIAGVPGLRHDQPQRVCRRRRRLRRPLAREPDGNRLRRVHRGGQRRDPERQLRNGRRRRPGRLRALDQEGRRARSRRPAAGTRPACRGRRGRTAPRVSANPASAALPPHPRPGRSGRRSPAILASLDLRRLDAVCNPSEPDLTLARGECCGYVATLLGLGQRGLPGAIWRPPPDRAPFPVLHLQRPQETQRARNRMRAGDLAQRGRRPHDRPCLALHRANTAQACAVVGVGMRPGASRSGALWTASTGSASSAPSAEPGPTINREEQHGLLWRETGIASAS